MSAFDSIFASANVQVINAFGRKDILFQPNCSDGYAVQGIFRCGEPISGQHRELFAEVFVMESELVNFPTKKDGVMVDGIPFIIADEPLNTRDGQGGVTLRLRKR